MGIRVGPHLSLLVHKGTPHFVLARVAGLPVVFGHVAGREREGEGYKY
jgi:hypothetical protein